MCNFIAPFLFSFKLRAALACDPLLLHILGENSKHQSSHFNSFPLPHNRANPPEAGGWTGQGSELYPQVFTSCARLLGSSAQHRFVWMLLLHWINLHAASPSASPYASQQSWGCITRGFIDMTQSKLYTAFIFCISSSKAYVALSNLLAQHWMIHNLSVITCIL